MAMLHVLANARQKDGSLRFAMPPRTFPSGDTETASFTIFADGSARFLTVSAGADVERFLGDDDHEAWIEFSPAAARELLGMLVRARFGPADNPYQQLKDFAEGYGIEIQTGHWT